VANKLPIIIITVLILVGAVSLFVFGGGSLPLISPLFIGNDQTAKISQKISRFNLDFSKSKELSALEAVPRYVVYNSETRLVYYSKGTGVKMSPASFSKLLSTQVAIDLIPLDKEITVSEGSIDKVPTILGLKSGEIFPASDLLRGAIATSANDSAQALADGAAKISGIFPSEFIYYMNKKAEMLDMVHSHFVNPDGLDDQNQYSTLEDITKLVNNVQKNYPEIVAAGKSDNQDIEQTATHGRYYLPNWNGLLGVYPGVTGLKIAYTEDAGYSTIVTAERDHLSMVAIVSGTGSYLERDRAAADLLDAAFMTKGLPAVRVSTLMLNRHYQVWGDLARKIRSEIKASQGGN
jgi:D-alanyl-D-alanine carboxypeptidase